MLPPGLVQLLARESRLTRAALQAEKQAAFIARKLIWSGERGRDFVSLKRNAMDGGASFEQGHETTGRRGLLPGGLFTCRGITGLLQLVVRLAQLAVDLIENHPIRGGQQDGVVLEKVAREFGRPWQGSLPARRSNHTANGGHEGGNDTASMGFHKNERARGE